MKHISVLNEKEKLEFRFMQSHKIKTKGENEETMRGVHVNVSQLKKSVSSITHYKIALIKLLLTTNRIP